VSVAAADGAAVEVAAGMSPPDPVGRVDGAGARPGRAMASAAISSTIATPPPSSTRRRRDIEDECTGL
jgi:hypothetical protein